MYFLLFFVSSFSLFRALANLEVMLISVGQYMKQGNWQTSAFIFEKILDEIDAAEGESLVRSDTE